MLVLYLIYTLNFVDRQILAILLPAIKSEFQVSDAFLGFMTGTAFALFYVTLGIPIGRYADKANRRNLIATAIAVWSGMTAMCGLATNVWQLLAARIGVGVGEAGCSPPAHSMIADFYPPEQRSTAMGFYTLGISTGIMLAYLAGGWVVENIGWRQAFFIVGVPGLLLAAIVRFTLPEPERGSSEGRTAKGTQPSATEVADFLLGRQSFVHIAMASGLSSFVGYAHIFLIPSFMQRSFGWGMSQLGVWLGLIVGIVGGVSFFFGGYIADRLNRDGARRSLMFISAAMLVAAVFSVAMFLASSAALTLVLFVLPVLTMNVYLAPALSLTQSLVSLRMRALASAIVLFVINAIGLALGPWLTGLLSDNLHAQFGNESMRYSLLFISAVVLPWAACHFYRAGASIENDLSRASEQD